MQIDKACRVLIREMRINANYARHWAGPSAPPPIPEHPRRIALVRLDRIGDFVLFSATLPAFRALYPDAQLDLVGNPLWQDLARFVNEANCLCDSGAIFDEFVAIDPGALVRPDRFRQAARRLAGYDLIISPVVSRTNALDKTIGASGAAAIGSAGECSNILPWQKRRNDRLYARLVDAPESTREFEKNFDFLNALAGEKRFAAAPPRWNVAPAKPESPYLAFSPFGSTPLKEWPEHRWVELAQALGRAHPDLPIRVLGSPRDARRRRFLAQLEACPTVENLAGRADLVETTRLLAQAAVSVGGDTAAAHIASAVGAPSVVMLGGGHYGRFLPYDSPWPGVENVCLTHRMECYGCSWLCKYQRLERAAAPCIARIEAKAALAEVERLIASGRNKERRVQ